MFCPVYCFLTNISDFCIYRILDILQKALWLLLHPLCLLTVVVMSYAALTFPDEPVPELLERGVYRHAFRQNIGPVWQVNLFLYHSAK